MSTVAELQAQLDALRARNAQEVEAAQATLAKLQQDLNYMQEDTEALEREEEELCKQFGKSRGTDTALSASQHTDIIAQGLCALVECDDSKCC
ncbi:hypothetical protein conserved [Leishmania donovani]|uniref:Uncharacterized protein n=3 Tax=Leishmania donovani species complex TaxID=38574 RepID=A4ICJ2_LEIIN|nr:conserved hypothetical protein [Leishmania infantum JPCM5]XP_003865415.1 hypothetical protein, conserved [Leishmania donovani]CAC9550727.1 hypothetical_protein_-_conserved [Leishmania infantum]AYU83649.1 hypothetical protein LdCL_360036300 [Leishmania donovani]CAJ1993666.1 hypothetical protein conserved [Leishmania donovani]CAM72570.1 conserved hypothetical protein [Leishmania infantum JPCM5]CBZ38738.1 hypothetical protein, conserved [Leishmania donovani]|eukprot:XP_001469461.1 conserved hypothetical protein [Leishmania infantum JPCM5]